MNNDPDTDTNVPVTPEAQAEGTAPVQSSFATPSKKQGRKPGLLLGGILAGALLLFGGGGALAYNMWYQNPGKVVHDAIVNSFQAKSMSTTGTMQFASDDVNFDLTFDSKSGEEGNGDFNVKANIAVDNDDMQQDFEANGSGRIVDGALYFKVSGIKQIVDDMAAEEGPVPAYMTSIIDKVEDKWISVKPSDYAEMDGEMARQQECMMDLAKKIQSDKDMKKEVVDLYRDNQIVVVKEELGSKSVNGTGSLGYRIDVDREAATAFARGIESTKLGQELKNCNDDIDFSDITEDITRSDNAGSSEVEGKAELWVSRFGHRITEFSVSGENKESGETMSMVVQPTFNGDVSVEAPSDAISLKDLLEEIQSAMMQQYMNSFDMSGFDESYLEQLSI